MARSEGPRGGAATLVQGGALYRARDYEGARQAFAHAYELDPSAGTLFDLALAELQSGRPTDSARHLRSYLARADAQADKADAIRTRWLPQAQARVAHVQVQGPAGVEIVVDGQHFGVTPTDEMELDGGQHSILTRKEQWSQEVTVIVRAGDSISMHIDVPEPPATLVASMQEVVESSVARTATEVALATLATAAAGGAIGFAVASGQATRVERAREADVALAFALGATVLAVGASVAWFAWPNPARRDQALVRAIPQFGAGTAGMAIVGAF
jgi:tetratricopeptide (TPR) repeat protein